MSDPHPQMYAYFEDYVVGTVQEFGSIAVEEAEVIAFAHSASTRSPLTSTRWRRGSRPSAA